MSTWMDHGQHASGMLTYSAIRLHRDCFAAQVTPWSKVNPAKQDNSDETVLDSWSQCTEHVMQAIGHLQGGMLWHVVACTPRILLTVRSLTS